ncbi:50S ribosomal protein L18 [Candidatus Kaiserbacteria bacterium RIFCSPHIGHO2_02_FULL_55_25]|uniref:Large ribosomal subunit protein uL18 n=1 Tax=Candidatus Kaiserbacteria bacterium RIFCSPHIGHO2_02_FULL_55_25 TaxID=1798498 RepID=A0A1F6EAC3_9BACT|nr:MAG: 50S ribosomal protein L18 [Candidatus Kaiserbacteria bacterium RIFCSPHIGHO2_01_FULL_55_79]OGG70616.1 MAG: 50S ribosomal protein L18 [Candidatus Kaiserbacteria bacterium RIFCSPHIGHO2_02_FULL_55_25]OGG78730.1 MAG: 50S ribosomal protein L18 [Candidatus Kaiserbacteria bacterium RIFCSPHIGHO2_12_FULL_55_13]OGG82693.1 MAG: 50S ribosomal protein L18 [Candidatus Kaiserbacteria bacterium RIFCSPLOWO2_01_FULL_55_25]
MSLSLKQQKRDRRHRRVRAKVIGSAARPRLCIYKSNTRLTAQIINDEAGNTLAAVSSADEKGKTPRERAEQAATTLAKRAKDAGIKAVVFDRGGFQYVGTVKAFADAARAAGLEF